MWDGQYAFEKSKIMQGDCLEKMKLIPDGSIDMILADLPYGTTACKWDTIIPFEPLWEQYERIIKDNGAIVLFGSEPFSSALRMSNIKNYKYDWVWEKNNVVGFANAKKMVLKNIENISIFYKKLPTYNPQGLIEINKECSNSISHTTNRDEGVSTVNGGRFKGRYNQKYTNYPRQVLRFDRPSKTIHRTQKPVDLLKYFVRTYTNEGEVILDNTAGSGSLGEACIEENRDFILIEKEPNYYEVIKERVGKIFENYGLDLQPLLDERM